MIDGPHVPPLPALLPGLQLGDSFRGGGIGGQGLLSWAAAGTRLCVSTDLTHLGGPESSLAAHPED